MIRSRSTKASLRRAESGRASLGPSCQFAIPHRVGLDPPTRGEQPQCVRCGALSDSRENPGAPRGLATANRSLQHRNRGKRRAPVGQDPPYGPDSLPLCRIAWRRCRPCSVGPRFAWPNLRAAPRRRAKTSRGGRDTRRACPTPHRVGLDPPMRGEQSQRVRCGALSDSRDDSGSPSGLATANRGSQHRNRGKRRAPVGQDPPYEPDTHPMGRIATP